MRPNARARATAVAFACLLAWTSSSAQSPASPPPLMVVVSETRAARLAGNHRAWLDGGMRALALSPGHPDLLISVARANAALAHRDAALAQLGDAVARGAGFDPDQFAEFAPFRADPDYRTLALRALANLTPLARAAPFATLPSAAEGITFDPVSNRLFVGTEDGRLLQIDAAGRVSEFTAGQGLRQVLGLKVDAGRRLLWVVTGRFPNLQTGDNPEPDAGTGGIYAFHLETGTRQAAHELDERPVLHGLNDMALARDGTIYATDSAAGAIYRLAPGSDRLQPLLADRAMTFPNGILLSADETRLYVAHVEGISIVDPRTGARTLLPVPPGAAVNSIDGLAWHDGALLGVQSSPYLHRVVRIGLTPDGRGIASLSAVNARAPAEYAATTAVVAGDALFIVGGAPSPNLRGGPAAEPRPQIWRVPLRPTQPTAS